MNNKTIHEFKIKYRGDRVYDLYVDGKWIISKGSPESVLNELKKVIEDMNN